MKDTLALASIGAFASGIVFASFFVLPLSTYFFLLLLSAGFFLAWFFGKRDVYLFPLLILLFLALGCMRTILAPHTVPSTVARLVDTKTQLSGEVISDPDVRESSQRLTVRASVDGTVTNVLVVVPRYPVYEYGDELTVEGKLQLPQPFLTDGGRTFAYDKFLAKDAIFSMMSFAHIEKVGEDTNPLTLFKRYLYKGKHAFARGVENALPEPHASLAQGLLVGGKQGLGKPLLEAFTIAGLLPLIVLSGYNVMIVAQSVLFIFSFLPKRRALVLAVVTIALFVLASGGGSSAIRAGLMAGLALFARTTGRTYEALRILLFVFIAMLIWNPLQLVYDPGFQFSFVATLGLIVLSPHLEKLFIRIKFSGLREIIATTLSAQLFVLPLLLYQTGNFSLVSIPANILELPVIPFTMLFSFLAGLVGLISPTLALYAGFPAYVLLAYIIHTAEFFASLPLAHVLIPAFSFAWVVGAYVLIALFVKNMKKRVQALPAGSL